MVQSQSSNSANNNNSSDSALGSSMRTPGQSQSTWSLASAAGDREPDTPKTAQRVDLYSHTHNHKSTTVLYSRAVIIFVCEISAADFMCVRPLHNSNADPQ